MSHIQQVKTSVKNKDIVKQVAAALGYKCQEVKDMILYERNKPQTGLAVYLKGWSYPIVIKEDGSIAYDNYNGAWGKQSVLDEFLNHYSLEEVKIQLDKRRIPYQVKQEKGKFVIEAQA